MVGNKNVLEPELQLRMSVFRNQVCNSLRVQASCNPDTAFNWMLVVWSDK